ncbi:MAG: hypothetical protein R3D30_08195 [Hyphomicrobiales bacterium]
MRDWACATETMYERTQERSGDKQDQQALSAEEAAFRRDLEGEIGWLWRLAKAITKNPVDADDVAQETLRRAIEKNHSGARAPLQRLAAADRPRN